MKVSSDGRKLLIDSNLGIQQVWDVESAAPLGERLGSSFFDGVRDLAILTLARALKPTKPTIVVRILNEQLAAFSPDNKRLVTGDQNELRLWDATTGRQLSSAIRHLDRLTFLAFSPDGNRLITATDQTLNWFSITANGALQVEKTQWSNAGKWASKPVILDSTG